MFSYINNELKDKLVINSFPSPDEDKVVPIGTRLPEDGSYSLTFSNFNSFYSAPEFYLKDRLYNKVYNLRKDSIIDITYYNGQAEHRFDLYFKEITAEPGERYDYSVSVSGNRIYLMYVDEYAYDTKVEIFNLLGQKIFDDELGNIKNGIEVRWHSAYYLMKLTTTNGKYVEKFLIP